MVRWMTMALMLSAVAAWADIAVTDSMRVKDKEGKSYAVIVDCPQPGASDKGAASFGGSEESTIGKDRCGKCLIDANYGVYLRFPYDLHIKGTLVDETGQPLANRMLYLFLPNSWTVKTRTLANGEFRFLLGATAERKSKEPLIADLGTKRTKKDSTARYYALYMLPEPFKPCGAAATPLPKSSGSKKKPK